MDSLPHAVKWGIFLILLSSDSNYRYYLIDEATELDSFDVRKLSFFHLYGIVDYLETFKMWLRKFPRPLLILGVKDRTVTAFVYIDHWEELPLVANVLRAQETSESLRGEKIGYKMFLLGIYLTPEYMITKPLTKKAKEFYSRLGFVDAKQINVFKSYHQLTGYLALPLDKKDEHIKKIREYFTEMHI